MLERVPVYGSDLVADLLVELGIGYVAMNPGASFRGLHDSLANHVDGAVSIVQCLHEEIAVAVAHGYAKAAGRPMAVALHDVVGLQHATMAIYNAWCDRVPILLLGATGPVDAAKRRPWIEWVHTANVQATQVRDYTKWDDQPASIHAVPESLIRGFQLAQADPQGPVYVCLDIEVQENPVPTGLQRPAAASYGAPSRMHPDPDAVVEVAGWLVTARNPVVIADGVGRSQQALDALITLAELVAAPVIDREGEYNKASLNFPTDHPLNVSGISDGLLTNADVVLGLECRDLFGSLNRVDVQTGRVDPLIRSETKVAHISLGHLVSGSWTADFQRLYQADRILPADLGVTLTMVVEAVRGQLGTATVPFPEIEARRESLRSRTAVARARWRALAAEPVAGGDEVITKGFLALTLGELLRDLEIVVANGHLGNWVHRLWSLRRADEYLGSSGGGGLGYGLGAAIGAALAHRETGRMVVNLQTDGDALFTPSALWTIAHENLRLLTVVDNNRGYGNSVRHASTIAGHRGRPVGRKDIGTTIQDPDVDFATLARAFGLSAYGPVQRRSGLRAALRSAIREVAEQGRPALVDVWTADWAMDRT